MSPPVTHSVDSDGIGWIVFDDPAGRANVLNPSTQSALRAALEALAAAPAKAVVVVSGKERIFIAGADLQQLAALPDAGAAEAFSREGQQLFERLASFPAPVVCAIHGACAGGGFELALACHWRIASDAAVTRIGLPEVGLGTIPGWGGCVRLPRLLGAPAALAHILGATLVPAAAALQNGLVDEVAPAGELQVRARAAALRLAAEGRPARATPAAADAAFFAGQRAKVLARTRGRQPAPLAAIDVIEQGAGASLAGTLALEAAAFGAVTTGDVCKNLVHVFRLKEAGRKQGVDAWFPAGAGASATGPAPEVAAKVAPPAPFRIVGIVGAGVMGTGIAQWCAAHGCGVILHDVDPNALKRGMAVIRELFHETVARGLMTSAEAHRAIGGMAISTDLEDFADCDLVIEAIVEDAAEKRKVFAGMAKFVPRDCVLASNTSALPIEEIGAHVENPGRTVGLHFFNPVSRMPLVELVLGPHTTRATAERAVAFVRALGKTPVLCKSSPGFFVTRVLFFYLNEACRLWEQGVPADVLDGAMGEWGWPMGPLRLIDEIGVDVSAVVGGEMARFFPQRFEEATICRRMTDAGLRGRKHGTGAGFYTYNGLKPALNPELARFAPAAGAAIDAPAIVARLMHRMIDETARCLAEGIVKTPDDADLALLLGAGFPAFRGGLRRYARNVGRCHG